MLERVGHYEIKEMLGDGGMGTVYRAIDPRFDRQVAVKVLHQHFHRDDAVADRFRNEAVIQAKLNHPNIVSVYDFVADDAYLAMILEFVDGVALSDVVRGGGRPIEPQRAVELFTQVLKAIGFAHSQGLIHRDIKPSNLMVQRLGHDEIAKVMDFGIAKILGSEKMRTVAGSALGTLAYMAPEQIRNPNLVTQSADIYSLGVTLYETLTAKVPFDAETEYDMMLQIVERPPDPPSIVVSGLTPGLDAVVLRALEKDPETRFESCAEFRQALAAATGFVNRDSAAGVVSAPPEPPAPPPAVEPAPSAPGFDSVGGGAGEPSTPSPAEVHRVDEFTGRVGALLAKGSWLEAERVLRGAERECDARGEFKVFGDLVSQARSRDLTEVVGRISHLLDGGDLDGAGRALDDATVLHGENDQLGSLSRRHLEAEESLAVEELLREFEDLLTQGDVKDAAEAVADLKSRYPERFDAEVVHRRLEDERETRISAASEAIASRLAAGEISEAEEILRGAVDAYGSHDTLTDDADEIEAARQQRLRTYLDSIEGHMDVGDLDAANRVLTEAALVCGMREEFAHIGDQLKGLRERERAIVETLARIESALAGGDLGEARSLLGSGQEDFSGSSSWDAAIPSLQLQLSEKRKARAEAIASLATEGELDLSDAQIQIERILDEDPGSARIRSALTRVEEAAHRVAEEARRQQIRRKTEQAADPLARGGNADQARRVLAEAEEELAEVERVFADRAELVELRKVLATAREEPRTKHEQTLQSEVRRLVARNAFLEANARLREAARAGSEESEIKPLADFIRQSEAEFTIRSLLEKGDTEGASRASKLAAKLFDDPKSFRSLCDRLGL